MKKSRLGKMMILVLAVVMVFAFATTAFAAVYDEYKYNEDVTGGASDYQYGANRDEYNSMDVYPIAIDWNGQSGWKFRGYCSSDGSYGTVLKSIYSTATYCASYTSGSYGDRYYMKMSIASPSSSDKLTYSGYLYF